MRANVVGSVGELGVDSLSPMERQCLRMVLENRSSKEIARRLGIGHTSVDTYVRRARAKLGVRTRYQAARLLADWEARCAPVRDSAYYLREPRASGRAREDHHLLPSLPPLAAISLLSRLGLMVAGAALMAAVFGVVLTAVKGL